MMLTSCSPGTVRVMSVTGQLYIPHPQAFPLPTPKAAVHALCLLLVIVTDADSQSMWLMHRSQYQLVRSFQT